MPRWARISTSSVGGAFLILLIAWLLFVIPPWWAARREIAEIRAKGEPVTWEDLVPPLIPDEENAAVLLTRATEKLRALRDGSFVNLRWSVPSDVRVRKLVDRFADVIGILHEAVQRPRCRHSVEMYYKNSPSLPGGLANLLSCEAYLHAREGRVREAEDTLRAMLTMGEMLSGDPQCPYDAARSLGLTAITVERILWSRKLPDGFLEKVANRLREVDFGAIAISTMVHRRVYMNEFLERAIREPASFVCYGTGDTLISRRARRFPSIMRHDQVNVLRLISAEIDASRLPPWRAVREFKRLDGWAEGLTSHGLFHPNCAAIHETSFCVYTRIVTSWSLRAAAVFGLACELYRSRNGGYPERLDQLVPVFLKGIPPDPFTGKPFIYRREGRRFLVYSVGKNLKDDGGSIADPRCPDVGWRGGMAEASVRRGAGD